MAETEDPRAQRSRAALVRAVTALVETTDVERISVTQVVAAAGVTRPTFYQHFADVPQLACDAAIERLAAEFERFDALGLGRLAPSPDDWIATVEPVVAELLHSLAAHGDFYRRVLTGPSAARAFTATGAFLTDRILGRSPLAAAVHGSASPEMHDRVTVISGGLVWLIINWLLTDRAGVDSPETMAHRITVQLAELVAMPIGGP